MREEQGRGLTVGELRARLAALDPRAPLRLAGGGEVRAVVLDREGNPCLVSAEPVAPPESPPRLAPRAPARRPCHPAARPLPR